MNRVRSSRSRRSTRVSSATATVYGVQGPTGTSCSPECKVGHQPAHPAVDQNDGVVPGPLDSGKRAARSHRPEAIDVRCARAVNAVLMERSNARCPERRPSTTTLDVRGQRRDGPLYRRSAGGSPGGWEMLLFGRSRTLNPARSREAIASAVEVANRAREVIGQDVFAWST